MGVLLDQFASPMMKGLLENRVASVRLLNAEAGLLWSTHTRGYEHDKEAETDEGFVPQPPLGMFRPLPALPLSHHIKAISRSVVVDGAEYLVSRVGTSQYNRDGTGASACGLAALNFARIAFSIEQSGLQDTTLLQAVLARACAEVRRRYSNPLSVHWLISSAGNHGYMRIVVGKPSSRSRRYLSRSPV